MNYNPQPDTRTHVPTTSEGIYYETDGEGVVAETDTVTFVGELGFGPWQWAWQAPTLAGPYRTIVPTSRGCGRSVTPPTPWTPADLLTDLRSVLRDAGVRRTHLVGAGLGGLLALHAAREIDRVERVAVLGTPRTPDAFDTDAIGPHTKNVDTSRDALAELVSESFQTSHPDALDRITAWRTEEDADPAAWTATRAAMTALDLEPIYEITAETLVIHGEADRVVSPTAARRLAEDLPRGTFHPVPDAGHLVGCEAARPVTDRLVAFLGELD